MSSGNGLVEKAQPRGLPQPLALICLAAAVVGIAAFVYGLGSNPEITWLSFQSNFIFFAALAQAGVILSCIFTIVNAGWPGPLRRFAEGLGAWVPVTLVLFCISWALGTALGTCWRKKGARDAAAAAPPSLLYSWGTIKVQS